MPTDQILETALPFLAFLISYIIQQAHWSAKINTAVAGATVIVAAVATLFIQHKLTGNVLADLLAVAALAAGLQTEALAPLAQWLRTSTSTTKPAIAASQDTATKNAPASPTTPAP